MKRYDEDGVRFDVPDEWTERTIVAFTAPASNGRSGPNVVLVKEPIHANESLRSHLDRQVLELSRQLKDFEIQSSRSIVISGRPAAQVGYTWTGPTGTLEQSMTLLEHVVGDERMLLTFTTTAVAGDAAAWRPVLADIVGSVAVTAARDARGSREERHEPALTNLYPFPGVQGGR